MKKRVLLVDDHVAIRQLLATLLGTWPGYEVVGEAGCGTRAMELCLQVRPDVVILDLMLPGLCGVEVLRRLSASSGARVLIFSGTSNESLLVDALRCRPAGYVAKGDSLKTLREALDAVAMGANYFTPFAARHLYGSRVAGPENGPLSPREREVLQLVAGSLSSKEIASHLGISLKTVENHRSRLMEKLRMHDVASLTRYAVRNGLVGVE
jgi:DNA-binding NarL/FixJ family response regulator